MATESLALADLMVPSASRNALGVHLSAIDMIGAIRTIEGWIESEELNYVFNCTMQTVIECQRNPSLREVVNAAGLRTPDDAPLLRSFGIADHSQVSFTAGSDLMIELCSRSQETRHRHFFYGGDAGVARELAHNMMLRFPKMKVADVHTPTMQPIGVLESEKTIRKINDSGADIIWIDLGSPRQEWWVANHRALLNSPVLITVRDAFDFHTGRLRQTPQWMRRNGLEWLFRLASDPKRFWQRQLVDYSSFQLTTLARHLHQSRDMARSAGSFPALDEEGVPASRSISN